MTLYKASLTAVLLAASAFQMAFAQDAAPYPTKPIRIVVPYPAGGGLDVLSRVIGERLGRALGQPVLVDNKPGGGTLLGAEFVARSAADGYTLMITTDSTMTINQHLYAKLPYDPVKDFTPITQLVLLNQLLLANPAVPANNLKQLIDYAKANPGKLNYASYGSGSQPHLAMETLKAQTGIDILHVPYKGIPQAVPAAVAGEVQLTFSGAASSQAFIKAGRLKALAVGGKKRMALLPDVPTFAESGFPDVPANAWFGLFAPAGTPHGIVMKLHAEVTRIMKDPEFIQKEVVAKSYDLVASTPEEFAVFLVGDSVRNMRAVKISGARVE
ncbi:Bug family tripartite tricarboxylate transporter substrate binding protein [Ottowia thiooxydans]|uniref:Bug family tripartite tricarboxylate transporter substrate binding protein n=1 Tax=Ottowia thiooxydans TaxID=219182 RepID=UPI0003FE5045|nr:tripartite tricarboxylate transporter substrate binding protein [Ottowia thiooxydans]